MQFQEPNTSPLSNSLIVTISKFQVMKKAYINPAIEVSLAEVEQIIAASITKVGGDADLEIGSGETPGEADVKESSFLGDNIFDD